MFTLNPEKIYFFDGAMGSMLQSRGLKLRQVPESLNLTNPELVSSIHTEYSQAGADFITANTFGANRFKLAKSGLSVTEVIHSGLAIARQAAKDSLVALDIGPTGRVIAPLGDASFSEVYDAVAEMVTAGRDSCDVILLETFTDLYELKAAALAALENSDRPVFATMSFEESGKTFFGASVESMAVTLEGLGVSALGVNCSLGPAQLVPIVERLCAVSHIPVMVQPNAGLPVIRDGVTHYDVLPEEFAEISCRFAEMGVQILGGCCGTTPEHISLMKKAVQKTLTRAVRRSVPEETVVCSPSRVVTFGKRFVVIGERLNPTGKKKLQQALRSGDMDYILREAVKQQDQNADILDLNAGLPDIDEPAVLTQALTEIQGIVSLPVQIDSSDHKALESAARAYNGKPLLNSVNGKPESLEHVLPVAKKYGACVLGLTLDEHGIPETADQRLSIARRIVDEAEKLGIPRRNILIDCLTLTASAQQKLVPETLKAIRLVKQELGVRTILGLSNVSFGLPRRPLVNRTMMTAAMMSGLDGAIINPGDADLQETLHAWNLLTGDEEDMQEYIAYCEKHPVSSSASTPVQNQQASSQDTGIQNLNTAIAKGLKDEAANMTRELLKTLKPLEIIEQNIVPALDSVGKDYESGRVFLPQLIKSAEAAKSAFEVLSSAMSSEENAGSHSQKGRGPVVLATVYGDVHDIGKNIVRTIFENYNFDVIDLGKDVPPEKIVEAVERDNVSVVGLSALMTTTVASMKETIGKLKASHPDVKVIVGGAVLTPELAEYAGADYYARDAMEGVRILTGLLE
ncbi:MAG: homocysteine S-methyltransferase family protein [Synergistaceae bacterium]|nr:homocysteine S-methyltransferase family protein [Synergistaceae bacterium]